MGPRTFGEKYCESLLETICHNKNIRVEPSRTQFHDRIIDGEEVEIKFSRCLEKPNERNLLEQILNYVPRGFVSSSDKFLANIQNIKITKFKVLYFGLMFDDKIEIFKMMSEDLLNNKWYGDKQHMSDSGSVKGKGQMHISSKNVDYFRDNYKFAEVSWEEVLQLTYERLMHEIRAK